MLYSSSLFLFPYFFIIVVFAGRESEQCILHHGFTSVLSVHDFCSESLMAAIARRVNDFSLFLSVRFEHKLLAACDKRIIQFCLILL